MLEASIAIARRMLPTTGVEIPRQGGMRTWLEDGSFFIEVDGPAQVIYLKGASLSEIGPFLSWDYERFALSSLESYIYCNIGTARPKALNWPLLKAYYSAFFAAHALMRATGRGVIRLEAKHAKQLSELASLFAADIHVTAGTFEFQLHQSDDHLQSVALKRLPDTGGAHEQSWRRFFIFLSELSEEVASNNEPESTTIVAEISDIKTLLASNGLSGGTWLSLIRNQINYQHQFGVWFPYSASFGHVYAVDPLNRTRSSTIRRDFSASRDPLNAFSAACQLIAAMNNDVAEMLSRKISAKRFKRLWERLETGD